MYSCVMYKNFFIDAYCKHRDGSDIVLTDIGPEGFRLFFSDRFKAL